MLASSDEPIPRQQHAIFLPLSYFPVDPDYDAPASLMPSNDPTIVSIPTSVGSADKYRRVGTLAFVLKGQSLKLTAFVPASAKVVDRLFVPFKDLTAGFETYGGGRFLDLDRNGTGIYEVDFNRAYNPYCYYNPTYACPVPPPENRLGVAIRAGERIKNTKE